MIETVILIAIKFFIFLFDIDIWHRSVPFCIYARTTYRDKNGLVDLFLISDSLHFNSINVQFKNNKFFLLFKLFENWIYLILFLKSQTQIQQIRFQCKIEVICPSKKY